MDTESERDIDLSKIYAPPAPAVIKAVTDHITEYHQSYLKKATFFCFATGSNSGLDVSPRGGPPGFVKMVGPKRIAFADWPGNNRIESLKNIQKRSDVGLCFLFPGLDVFLRINGHAWISRDTDLLHLVADGKRIPKTAAVVDVGEVLFHCGKAVNRAALWAPESLLDKRSLPSVGTILKALALIEDIPAEAIDEHYDREVKHDLY